MTLSCNNCSSEKCFINHHCSRLSIETVEKRKCVIHFKKGQYIFREGDSVQGIYVINSGKIKILSTGFNKKKQIISLAKTGCLVGHRGFGDKYYLISAVAIEDSVLCFLETEVFTQILNGNPRLTYQLMLLYGHELRMAESRMKNLAQMTVREKSAESLLIIKQYFGVKNGEEILLDSSLTRRDMAELAGLSPEQISKCFSEFRREKIIRMDGKKIIILRPQDLFKLIAPYNPVQIIRERL